MVTSIIERRPASHLSMGVTLACFYRKMAYMSNGKNISIAHMEEELQPLTSGRGGLECRVSSGYYLNAQEKSVRSHCVF